MKTVSKIPYFKNTDEIKEFDKGRGGFYFSPDTMHFFNSAVHEPVYGGRYFVTSEQGPHDHSPRTYTVREVRDDGDINTAKGCEFQEFRFLSDAQERAQELAEGGG